jgi:hypothetical protein
MVQSPTACTTHPHTHSAAIIKDTNGQRPHGVVAAVPAAETFKGCGNVQSKTSATSDAQGQLQPHYTSCHTKQLKKDAVTSYSDPTNSTSEMQLQVLLHVTAPPAHTRTALHSLDVCTALPAQAAQMLVFDVV